MEDTPGGGWRAPRLNKSRRAPQINPNPEPATPPGRDPQPLPRLLGIGSEHPLPSSRFECRRDQQNLTHGGYERISRQDTPHRPAARHWAGFLLTLALLLPDTAALAAVSAPAIDQIFSDGEGSFVAEFSWTRGSNDTNCVINRYQIRYRKTGTGQWPTAGAANTATNGIYTISRPSGPLATSVDTFADSLDLDESVNGVGTNESGVKLDTTGAYDVQVRVWDARATSPTGCDTGTWSATSLGVQPADATYLDIIPTELLLIKGGSAGTISVSLEYQPTQDVTVDTTWASGPVSVSPRTLTFTPANYSTVQTVTVTPKPDFDLGTVVDIHFGAGGAPEYEYHSVHKTVRVRMIEDRDSNSPPQDSPSDGNGSSDAPPVPAQPIVVQLPPPACSVGNAMVTEGPDAQLVFTVSLDRAVLASEGTVSVAYATRDVTATAGADYIAASGTLTFATGESTKTVIVRVLEDTHGDDGEILELVLSKATGATIADDTGTGTIKNTAMMPWAWASRFGRTIGTHVTDAVSARLRNAGDAESHLTVAGWRVPLGSETQADATASDQGTRLLTGLAGFLGLNGSTGSAQSMAPGNTRNGTFGGNPNGTPWLNGSSRQQNPGQAVRLPDLRQALIGSAFRLTLNQDADGTSPRLTAWGRVAHMQFDGQEDRLTLDGEVTTGILGPGHPGRPLAGRHRHYPQPGRRRLHRPRSEWFWRSRRHPDQSPSLSAVCPHRPADGLGPAGLRLGRTHPDPAGPDCHRHGHGFPHGRGRQSGPAAGPGHHRRLPDGHAPGCHVHPYRYRHTPNHGWQGRGCASAAAGAGRESALRLGRGPAPDPDRGSGGAA